jgi:hypothetical protein
MGMSHVVSLHGRNTLRGGMNDGASRLDAPARAQLFRDQRIGGFLHAIVGEPVGARQTLDEFLMNGRPESCVDLILRPPKGN